jgi:hypothetical protein
MALADYYSRAAVAAAQVIAGFDEEAFRGALETACVGISFDRDAAETREGQTLLNLAVRLLARLYPTIALQPAPGAEVFAEQLTSLAKAINPNLTVAENAGVGIAVGCNAPAFNRTIFAGSRGWTATLSCKTPQAVGDGPIPFGAGAAACLAAAVVFRIVLLDDAEAPADVTFSCLDGVDPVPEPAIPDDGWCLPEPTVLVGCGAVGQAAVWALARSPLRGDLFLVDGELIELSNMQRYVLTTRQDEDAAKTHLAADNITNALNPRAHPGDWASFTTAYGHRWAAVLTALDSAAHRRAVQAALPQWIANAWTQPGDLGVSTHAFMTDACLACLYIPTGPGPNEDAIVANALGIPDRAADVRTLLHTGAPTPAALLDVIATGLGVSRDRLDAFEGQPIRKVYVDGVCGGAVLPLGMAGTPRQDVHVPLAHQSALAGVLLAARLVRMAAGADTGRTEITRLNILRNPGEQPTQYALKDPRGICICQDADYQDVYTDKWAPPTKPGSPSPDRGPYAARPASRQMGP